MKGSGLFRLLSFLFFISVSVAWPWPESMPNVDALIVRRQDDNSNSASQTPAPSSSGSAKQTGTTSADDSQSTNTDESNSDTASGSAAATTSGGKSEGKSSGNSTASATRTSNKGSNSTQTVFDPRLPAGGVAMVTPSAIAGAQYYKIGDYVHFAWNYTSLEVTPTAIDIMASCSANQQLYTIAMNQTVDPTGEVYWDTGAYQSSATVPLLTETYTLVIYDAAEDVSATARAGYLAVYNQYTFGMYSPQPYTPLNEFKCATCSAALSDHERQALSLVVGMGVITVLSFSWFAGSFGVFS